MARNGLGGFTDGDDGYVPAIVAAEIFFSMFESNFCPPVWIRIAYPDQDADPWSGKLTYHLPYNIDIERTSI